MVYAFWTFGSLSKGYLCSKTLLFVIVLLALVEALQTTYKLLGPKMFSNLLCSCLAEGGHLFFHLLVKLNLYALSQSLSLSL